MHRSELLTFAFETLPDAVGGLLRAGHDPAAYILTAAPLDSPVGELLQHRSVAASDEAVCVMLPTDGLSRILEAYAFESASAHRLAAWLAESPGAGRYRVVAIGQGGLAALTVDTTGEDETDGPVSVVPH
jgi:hypothetical protein